MWETEFSIPPEQAEKRSGCLKPGNGFLSVGRAAETFPLRHQRRLFHVLIRPAHPGIFLSYAEAPAKPPKRSKKQGVRAFTDALLDRTGSTARNTRRFLISSSLVNRHGAGHGSADHGVVAHTHQAHHFHVGGYGGGAGKLGVAMHTAHGVGQAVRGGAGGHIVGMQGAAGAAAGSDGEVLFAVFQSPFLIGAGYQMLEPGGVGGVAGDGNVYASCLQMATPSSTSLAP